MTESEQQVLRRVDKNIESLSTMLQSHSEQIVSILRHQESRDTEIKEILTSISIGLEKSRALSIKATELDKRTNEITKRVTSNEREIALLDMTVQNLKLFNKRIIAGALSIGSAMAYFIFHLLTASKVAA